MKHINMGQDPMIKTDLNHTWKDGFCSYLPLDKVNYGLPE